MNKTKIFGYVESERNEFIEEIKSKLVNKGRLKASKSKIIELALIELQNNNNFSNIERKLIDKKMI